MLPIEAFGSSFLPNFNMLVLTPFFNWKFHYTLSCILRPMVFVVSFLSEAFALGFPPVESLTFSLCLSSVQYRSHLCLLSRWNVESPN